MRWVEITQTPDGPAKAVTGTAPRADDPGAWNPAEKGPEVLDRVPEDATVNTMDPLSLFSQVLTHAKNHLDGGPIASTYAGFDGRRRFDMDVEYLGPAHKVINDAEFDTYHLRVTPHPKESFKERQRDIWTGSVYDCYLSRDGNLLAIDHRARKTRPG